MIALGTIVNAVTVLAGGSLGLLCGKRLTERYRATVMSGMAACVMVIGLAGTLREIFSVAPDGSLKTAGELMLVASMGIGALIGEWLDIDAFFERVGARLRRACRAEGDGSFVNAFVTASLTFCVGAISIVGSIEDGIKGDPSILLVKATIDGVVAIVFAASLGKGALFSALTVIVYQGALTLLARVLAPVVTDGAMSAVSLAGNVIIFCIGWNLIHDAKKIRVANLLPAIVIAVIWRALLGV